MSIESVTADLGPALGADLIDQLRPPEKPARMSQRRYVDTWDSNLHRVEVTNPDTGRPVFRCTVAGRLSATAAVARFAAQTVRVRPGRS